MGKQSDKRDEFPRIVLVSPKPRPTTRKYEHTLQVMGLIRATDLLRKFSREITRLKEAQKNKNHPNDILDHGLNAAITGWHLVEWLAQEMGQNVSAYRMKIHNICPNLGLMHDVATQIKHFKVTNPKRVTKTQYVDLRVCKQIWLTKGEVKKIVTSHQKRPGDLISIRPFPKNRERFVLQIEHVVSDDEFFHEDALSVFEEVYDVLKKEVQNNRRAKRKK